MLAVEAIPYRSFKEKIRIVSEELAKNRHVEVWDKFIYSAEKIDKGRGRKMSKWCNKANCWCDDVREITDEQLDCDYDCNNCEECEEIIGQPWSDC